MPFQSYKKLTAISYQLSVCDLLEAFKINYAEPFFNNAICPA